MGELRRPGRGHGPTTRPSPNARTPIAEYLATLAPEVTEPNPEGGERQSSGRLADGRDPEHLNFALFASG